MGKISFPMSTKSDWKRQPVKHRLQGNKMYCNPMEDEVHDNKSCFKQHGNVSTTEIDGESYDLPKREINSTVSIKKIVFLSLAYSSDWKSQPVRHIDFREMRCTAT